MTNDKLPPPGRGNAGESPRVFNTLDKSFLVDRRSDGKERVVRRGEGFGPPPAKASSAPNPPGTDPRGSASVTLVRDPQTPKPR